MAKLQAESRANELHQAKTTAQENDVVNRRHLVELSEDIRRIRAEQDDSIREAVARAKNQGLLEAQEQMRSQWSRAQKHHEMQLKQMQDQVNALRSEREDDNPNPDRNARSTSPRRL